MEIDYYKLISIFFSLAILGNAYIFGKAFKTFLNPPSLFSLFWFLYTFFPLIFLIDVPINPFSIIFIFLCTLFFSLSSFFFDWNKAFHLNKIKLSLDIKYLNNKFLTTTFRTTFILIFIFLVIDIKIQGFELSSFFTDFYKSSNQFMVKRYSNEIEVNIYSQISNILNYFLVMLGGVLLGSSVKSNYVKTQILIASLLPSIFITLSQAAKGTILLAVFLLYGGTLITKIFNNKMELTDKKTNKVVLVIISALIIIMYFSFMSRGLFERENDEIKKALFFYFNSYAFAHVYAFSDWFSFYVFDESFMSFNRKEMTYGFYTFMAIFKSLGSSIETPPGIYDEYFYYKDVIRTNIYTIFRGNILDFGILGSFIFWFIAGVFSNCIFYVILCLKKPTLSIPIFIIMIGYFYTSFIISLFIWKSIFGAIILLYIILFFNKYKFKI